MRCKEHLTDLSSSLGVCATCLRQRLLAVLAAQAQLARAAESRRKPDPQPLIFPRSVSPYVSRRKSEDGGANWIHNQRFYSTPQAGRPTHGDFEAARSFKKKNRFSLFTDLFRSRSEKFNSDPSVHFRRDSSDEPSSSSSSPSLFSSIFAVRRKKNQSSRTTRVEEFGQFGPGDRKPCRFTDRGMSPAIEADSGGECDRLPPGISVEASPQWKRTPKAARRARNSSGMAFCLSPLVRASPNRQWNQKGGLPPDMSFTGDGRSPMKPQLGTAAGYPANRSRKLAEMGTVNYKC
ncbi:hypothetical protein GQ457_11G000380 [Hibiscus cannabinus]